MRTLNLTALSFAVCLSTSVARSQQQDTAVKSLQVAEAKLGKGVQDRQITDETTGFALNEKAYLWVKVVGGPSDSISVTWKTADESYSTKLNIGGSPWRTWSYKTLAKAGDWTVTVSDAQGNVLKEVSFKVDEMKQ